MVNICQRLVRCVVFAGKCLLESYGLLVSLCMAMYMRPSLELQLISHFLFKKYMELCGAAAWVNMICKRCSFEYGIGKYSPRLRKRVWAFRRTPYSVACAVFFHTARKWTLFVFSILKKQLQLSQNVVQASSCFTIFLIAGPDLNLKVSRCQALLWGRCVSLAWIGKESC